MIKNLKDQIKAFIFRKQWRKANKHNFTYPKNVFDMSKVTVGNYTYGPICVVHEKAQSANLLIGHFVSIAEGTVFLLGNHRMDTLSTYPFKVIFFKHKCEAISKGETIIEDDVWIGFNSLILSGVKIGKGAVVAAGSVVTKDVAPFSIVAGVPARFVRYRFENKTFRDMLSKIDLRSIDANFIRDNIDLFTSVVTEDIVNLFIQKLS